MASLNTLVSHRAEEHSTKAPAASCTNHEHIGRSRLFDEGLGGMTGGDRHQARLLGRCLAEGLSNELFKLGLGLVMSLLFPTGRMVGWAVVGNAADGRSRPHRQPDQVIGPAPLSWWVDVDRIDRPTSQLGFFHCPAQRPARVGRAVDPDHYSSHFTPLIDIRLSMDDANSTCRPGAGHCRRIRNPAFTQGRGQREEIQR